MIVPIHLDPSASPANGPLQNERLNQLKAVGCTVEEDETKQQCVLAESAGKVLHWDFVDDLPLYSEANWRARLAEYTNAMQGR